MFLVVVWDCFSLFFFVFYFALAPLFSLLVPLCSPSCGTKIDKKRSLFLLSLFSSTQREHIGNTAGIQREHSGNAAGTQGGTQRNTAGAQREHIGHTTGTRSGVYVRVCVYVYIYVYVSFSVNVNVNAYVHVYVYA